ncbi:MAG: MBL fold metallo-hydrolase [Magnetospirillum sp.]|nr:MBL fold metallo-hydrolase [Magnetospirillum sp.]
MGLMAEIVRTRVERKSMAVWFLGQNGWAVKTPANRVLVVDPYFSESCHPSRRGLDLRRQVPVPIAPEDLVADVVACTHSHRDHADPATLLPARQGGRVGLFLGPAQTQAVFAAAGIADGRTTWPGDTVEVGDLRLSGTFALPTDTTDLTPMGFVVEVDDGPKLWIVGDSAWCDLLAEDGARHAPQALCVPINGGYANLSHWEAAELVRRVAPRQAFPCHFDMFADNSCDPRMFAASLAVKGIGERYAAAVVGQRITVAA